MKNEEIIRTRKYYENKYTNICLHNRIPLNTTSDGSRVISVSPTALYYHCGVNPNGYDRAKFIELNKKAHFGERARIEEEVISLCRKHLYDIDLDMYFFKIKDGIENWYSEYKDWVEDAQKYKKRIIKKDKFHRVMKLLKKWSEISKSQHHKLTPAQKRLHVKYKGKEELNVFA